MNTRLFTGFSAGFVIISLPLLSACGGGGGGGGNSAPGPTISGNTFAPISGPGDTSHYFPAAAGNEWSYNGSSTDSASTTTLAIVSVAVTGTRTIQGAMATVFTTSGSPGQPATFDENYGISNGGVTALGNTNPSDTISPLIIPYAQQLFPVQAGPVSSVIAANLPAGTDSGGHPITLSVNQTISNGAFETVEVPAGIFTHALNQSTTINASVSDSGKSAPITGIQNTWYVAGIGEIKSASTTTGAGVTVTTASELRGYTVNGVQHGLGPITTLSAALAQPGCASAPAAVPAVGSDGSDFLIVAHQCAMVGGNPVGNWFGILVGPDGATRSTFNITGQGPVGGGDNTPLHATMAFDGTNYLVVLEELGQVSNQTQLNSVLISRTGTLVTAPTAIAHADRSEGLHSDAEALAFDGSRYLLVYTAPSVAFQPAPEVAQFISAGTGQPSGTPFTISGTGVWNSSPALAFDGTNYLAVWVQNQTTPTGLYGARISTAGTLLDASPIQIVDGSTADFGNSCCDFSPAVSSAGGSYLVAYRDTRGAPNAFNGDASISATRVSTTGMLMDGSATSPGIVVTASKANLKGRVRSALIDGSVLLIWETGQPLSLAATRIAPATGAVSTTWPEGFSLVPASDTIGSLALGTGSGGAYLAWLNGTVNPKSVTSLGGLRIFTSGP